MTDRPDLDAMEQRCAAATPGGKNTIHLPSGYEFDLYLMTAEAADALTDLPAAIAYARWLEGELAEAVRLLETAHLDEDGREITAFLARHPEEQA